MIYIFWSLHIIAAALCYDATVIMAIVKQHLRMDWIALEPYMNEIHWSILRTESSISLLQKVANFPTDKEDFVPHISRNR